MGNDNEGCKIWFHADDYGVTSKQSQKILECYKEGALNSISVIPNSKEISESLKILDGLDPEAKIRRVLHINFVEGRPCAGADKVPLLVDREGYFSKSFIDFFKWNMATAGKKRQKIKDQIKAELREQLRTVTQEHNYRITAIDSHQHYHMIPIVFDSLMEILSEEEFKELGIQYIRIPVDPLYPPLCARDRARGLKPVNLVKWCILDLYAQRNRRQLKLRGIKSPVFFGILYTCEMKWETVNVLLPRYKAWAEKKGEDLELMFHPGGLSAEYELLDARNKELVDFYMSDNRFYEADCLRLLRHDMSSV